MWLCPDKTLFTKTGDMQILFMGYSLLTVAFEVIYIYCICMAEIQYKCSYAHLFPTLSSVIEYGELEMWWRETLNYRNHQML